MKFLEGTIAAVARNTCVGSQHCHLSWIQRLLLPQAGVEDVDLGEDFVPFPDTGILSLECDLAHLQEIVHR